MQAVIHIREVLGDSILYHLRAGEHQLRAVRPAAEVYDLDQPIGVSFDWSRVFVFDAQTERALVA
jgi:hypothetical protein